MNKMTEEDVKVKYITPALQNKDWDPKTQMRFEYYYTAGKINVRGNITQRSSGKKVDYLLYYKSNLPIAVVEAKDNTHQVADGLQQGIGYAEDLDVPFAYSSNGFGFREHDMITGAERNLAMDEFPTAKELWERYKAEKNITEEKEKLENSLTEQVEKIQDLIDINSRVAQNQEKYKKEYDALIKNYDETKCKFEQLEIKLSQQAAKHQMIKDYINTLKKQEKLLTKFDGLVWGSLLESATIKDKDVIVFRFKDGTEING